MSCSLPRFPRLPPDGVKSGDWIGCVLKFGRPVSVHDAMDVIDKANVPLHDCNTFAMDRTKISG